MEYVQFFTVPCDTNDTSQLFTVQNSSTDPTFSLLQGANVIGVVGNFLVSYPPSVGAGLAACNTSAPGQQIGFTGGENSFGLLENSEGHCLSGTCSDQSCYPSPFVTCNSSDPRQLWTHTFYNTFINLQSGDCLDAYNEVVGSRDFCSSALMHGCRAHRLACFRVTAAMVSRGKSARTPSYRCTIMDNASLCRASRQAMQRRSY